MKNQTIQNASQEIVPGDPDHPGNKECDLLTPYLLAPYWRQVREKLFPLIQEETGLELTGKLKSLAQILEIVRIEQFVPEPQRGKRGGQEIDRRPLARAFVAKAFFNLSQTRALKEQLDQCSALRKLCGMETAPSEPTFSRAFSQFARMKLGQLVHSALVEKFVSPQIVMHVSHDLRGNELLDRFRGAGEGHQESQAAEGEKKRGRPKKGEERPAPEPTRIERQVDLPAKQALAELSTACDWGVKHDTDGNEYRWRGYKAHLSWADGMIPLLCVTTSASVHDSQSAIPMMKRLASCVTSLYDLMDSAYDAPGIRHVSDSLGHVALIDQNPRRGEKVKFPPAEAIRYRERGNAERGNSRLKDSFGLRAIYVRGHDKVDLHIQFAVLALFAHQILKPFGHGTDS